MGMGLATMDSANRRINRVCAHIEASAAAETMSITVTDNRNGKTYDVPIMASVEESKPGMVKAAAFDGLRLYDPGYTNTCSATSRITWINGDKGILLYRGYDVNELADKSSYLETAFLLVYGELPSANQLKFFSDRVMSHTYLHTNLETFMQSFRYDAHPMGMVMSTMAALGTFYPRQNPSLVPESNAIYKDVEVRNKQIHRILGKAITVAANAYRHRVGKPYNTPSNSLGYTENFLYMMDRLSEVDYVPNPHLAKVLDVLFILHADHEMNCSTAAMRHLSSSGVDCTLALLEPLELCTVLSTEEPARQCCVCWTRSEALKLFLNSSRTSRTARRNSWALDTGCTRTTIHVLASCVASLTRCLRSSDVTRTLRSPWN